MNDLVYGFCIKMSVSGIQEKIMRTVFYLIKIINNLKHKLGDFFLFTLG